VRGLQSKRGLETEVAFLEKQSRADKKRHDDLVYRLKMREAELTKLRDKDREMRAAQ
jgi:hypothetical protein